MKPITRTFDYTPVAQQGDGYLKRKFAAIRKADRERAEAQAAAEVEQRAKVKPIKGKA